MKISDKIVLLCQRHTAEFKSCKNCPIEKECEIYRNQSIRMYEEFKIAFYKLEKKINENF